MAYRIVKNAAAWWPVRWNDVHEDGTIVEREISLKFRRHPYRENEVAGFEDLTNLEFALAVATDWRGVENEGGTTLPFDEANLGALLDQPGKIPLAIVEAWRACLAAEPERRLGNSGPSPADGRSAAAPEAAAPATTTA